VDLYKANYAIKVETFSIDAKWKALLEHFQDKISIAKAVPFTVQEGLDLILKK